jgi:hypothetical protein
MDVICLTPQTEIIPKIPTSTPQEIANISETQLLNLSMTGGPATPPKQMATKKGRPKGAVKPKVPKANPIAAAGDVGKLKEKNVSIHHHPNHPPWAVMMVEAVTNLHHRGGSSVPAIKKYITSTFTIDNEKITPLLRRGAKAALTSNKLKQVKGKGLSGSFKLPPNGAHTKTILGNKKPKSAKKTKLAKAKNPAARKKIVKAKDSTKTATGEKKVKKAIKIKPAKGKISKKPKKTTTATKKKVEPGTKIPAENIALDASLAEPIPISTNVTPKTKKAVIKPKTAPKPKKVAKKALAPKSAGIKVKLATPKKAKIKSAKLLKSRKAPKPKTTMKLGAPKVAATGGAKKK